ncbi:plastid transcriptionally active protein [Thalictrum thalictroides]|uniref:Plastid transcriptionally active protein n=1 Tax=Thalictrum thalictroides TaxID=46969 RepID=A0A7J6WSG6_THATH|nr:plastid transcriptionally active protein [Thalictrum thalictroides]
MFDGIPRQVRVVGTGAAILLGGMFSVSVVSSVTIRTLQAVAEAKRKKYASPCGNCRGKGFYTCKLCKGNSTIKWSPLYDPVVINPCVCPTCEGNRIQRCLNCLGKGYS